MPVNLTTMHPPIPDGYNSKSLVNQVPVRTPTVDYVASQLLGLTSNAIGIAAGAVLSNQWGREADIHGSHIIVPGAAVVGNIIDTVSKLKALTNHHVFGHPEFEFRLGCPASYACGLAALAMLLPQQEDSNIYAALCVGMGVIGVDALWAMVSQSIKGNGMFSSVISALSDRRAAPPQPNQPLPSSVL